MLFFYLIVLTVIYLFVSEIYMKRMLGIKERSRWIFHDERYKVSMIIDVVIVLAFIFISFEFIVERPNSPAIVMLMPSMIMAFLISINRGVEDYLQDPTSKAHYHEWLAACMVVLAFGVFYLWERGSI
ncbi:DUF4181 domain-containing protein [Alkalihalobacillus sp. CinArs1]|uniref:DUF4181 domain-containing protein n=1 Tax=Alkalihalobacillus sp. CinArs1 TaxID=2995314 RepID=UPI0022DCF45C|nr:DUF4181 domain-containing protein [Alkalihalobacillus sp. CinArs1]